MRRFGRKNPSPMPAWHPDFRDPEALPDVKVVRTSFFIHGACFLAFAAVALLLLLQAFRQSQMREAIREFEARIVQHTPENERVLKMHGEFVAHQRSIDAVANYLDGSLEVSKLLVALGETLYPTMTLSSLRYEGGGTASGPDLVVSGTIQATPDAAASLITDYLEVLGADPFFEREFSKAVLSSLVPSQGGSTMAFGIQLRLKTGEPATEEETK